MKDFFDMDFYIAVGWLFCFLVSIFNIGTPAGLTLGAVACGGAMYAGVCIAIKYDELKEIITKSNTSKNNPTKPSK